MNGAGRREGGKEEEAERGGAGRGKATSPSLRTYSKERVVAAAVTQWRADPEREQKACWEMGECVAVSSDILEDHHYHRQNAVESGTWSFSSSPQRGLP